MKGFIKQRTVVVEKGDLDCRHVWTDQARAKCPRCQAKTKRTCDHVWARCSACPAWRQLVGGFTVYWSTIDPATGTRKQESKGGFARKEPARPPRGDSAREYLNSIVGSVQDGSWRKDRALTVKQLLETHWLPAQRSRELRPATLEQYRNVVDSWIVPNLGALRVPALTPKDVTRMVETLRTTKSAAGRKG